MNNAENEASRQDQAPNTPLIYPSTPNNLSMGNPGVSPIGQSDPVKRPRLPRLVKIFSFLFWVPFAFLATTYAYLVYEANHGVSGTEFVGIILAPVALLVGILGIVYLVLLLLYAKSKNSSKKQKILSLVVALVLVCFYSWQVTAAISETNKINQSKKLLTDSEVLSLIDSCKVESVQKEGDKVNLLLVSSAYYDKSGDYLWRSTTGSSANFNDFVAEVQKVKATCGDNVDAFDVSTGPEITWVTVAEATELLQQCKVKTFNYTQSAFTNAQVKDPSSGVPTGIILYKYPTINHLYIKPAEETTMVPIARNVQAQCGGPQFYHDNNYEQPQPDGSWR